VIKSQIRIRKDQSVDLFLGKAQDSFFLIYRGVEVDNQLTPDSGVVNVSLG
jgi:hypothetical protein